MNKTTIYIDIEDDITAIIEKIKQADSTIIALVPPKKSVVMQSAVNLKLLRKMAHDSAKRLVIISNDAALLPLAGSLKMHVAKSLNSLPYIPEVPDMAVESDITLSEQEGVEIMEEMPIGALSEAAGGEALTGDQAMVGSPTKPKKPKIGRKIPIPNFNRFRTKLILAAVGAVVLVVGWYVAFMVMPSAQITIFAQTTTLPIELSLTLDDTLTADDLTGMKLQPVLETLSKTVSQTVTATGQKNVGLKAKGLITIRNCDYPAGFTVEAGTRFESNDKHGFITTEVVAVPAFSGPASACDVYDEGGDWGSATVHVEAENSGTAYNIAAQGYSFNVGGDVLAIGGQMNGGTNQYLKVVAQADIDQAVATATINDQSPATRELEAQFATSAIALPATFTVTPGMPVAEPALGLEAEEVVVSLTYNYTMKGVAKTSLETLIDTAIKAKITDRVVEIFDSGIDSMITTIDGNGLITVTTDAYVGPAIDTAALAKEISGLRYGKVIETLEAKPSISSVDVKFNPFWVFSAPKASRITIEVVIDDPTATNTEQPQP